ncbi:YugN family protein [Sporosarcina obsidiansis]|uniref:YugN family protein n=1 Tax=Sporosarcina obsidiansis TaxID=2660748 RepID=UPI00129BBA3C|nr:YugN family protein [Sporosarcina obsidiansis]
MIELKTNLDGKKSLFGDACKVLGEHDISMGGNWDFDRGNFDTILNQDGGESIYLRLPFDVVDGMLDEDNAMISFRTPFIIKHVVNIGLDNEDSPVLAAAGLDQFQTPTDKDAPIVYDEKWVIEGEERIAKFSDHPIFIAPFV